MKKGTSKTALANILDKVNQLQTVDGGDVSTAQESKVKESTHEKNLPFADFSTALDSEKVISVDPYIIKNWYYSDRPESELGDIAALAIELKTLGQQQPCIVRACTDGSKFKYEIIAGERRWRAAKEAGIPLKVVVKFLNDHDAAICQAAENSQRKDLSEYAKGINYAQLIENEILTRQELQDKLNISKSSIRNLLSYSRISKEILDAIGDLSNVSPGTAYAITRLQEKGSEYIQAITLLAPKIRTGKVGHAKLDALEKSLINIDKDTTSKALEIHSPDGRHVFTWRNDTNGNRSITFPKDIRGIIDFAGLEKVLLSEIEFQLQEKKQAKKSG